MSTRSWSWVVASLLLLATACSGGEQDAGSDGPTAGSAAPDGTAESPDDRANVSQQEGDVEVSPSAVPPQSPEASAGSGGAGELPITDALNLDVGTLVALSNEEEIRVEACMRAQGFEYVALKVTEADVSAEGAASFGRYGLTDLGFASENGYGFAADEDHSDVGGGAFDPNAGVIASLSAAEVEAWQSALIGDQEQRIPLEVDGEVVGRMPGNGCVAEARSEVFPDRVTYLTLRIGLERMQQAAFDRVSQGDRYLLVVQAWRECMTGEGYGFASEPFELEWVFENGLSAEDQRDVATQDVLCKQEVGLIETLGRLESEYQRSLLERDESQAVLVAWLESRNELTEHLLSLSSG